MAALDAPGEPARRPSRPRRTLLTGLRLTAVAAVAVAAVVFVRSTDARLATPVAMSARSVLLAAAERIETATPATGRYWHTVGLSMALRSAGQGPPGGGTPKSVGYRVTCTHELWMAKSGRDPSWLVVTAQSGKPLTGADEETWRLQGRWRLSDCDGAGVPGVGPLTAPPFAVRLDDKRYPEVSYPMVGATPVTTKQVMDLPADPAALKKVLQQWARQAGQQSDEALFAEAVSLLSQLPTTPRIRAALYRMLADLPGVQNLGRISDPLGRVGTGIELQGGVQRIVIDEASGRPLAMEDRLDGDELTAWTALTASGWTDARPVLPEQR
ncbi:CU044_5270 family protein [Nonomuraea sp. NPDC047529]|uniref:CU044_5270 family protein n=1 Tax=Nonomuraea sp. NPDC047529 TaxID=3155623 RepID=UPI0033DD952B